MRYAVDSPCASESSLHGLLPRDPAERQIAGVDRDGSTAERERLQRHGAMLGASRIVKRYLSGWEGDQIIGKALHKVSVSKVASGQGMVSASRSGDALTG